MDEYGSFLQRINSELEMLMERKRITSYNTSVSFYPEHPPDAKSVDVSIEVSFPVRERGE